MQRPGVLHAEHCWAATSSGLDSVKRDRARAKTKPGSGKAERDGRDIVRQQQTIDRVVNKKENGMLSPVVPRAYWFSATDAQPVLRLGQAVVMPTHTKGEWTQLAAVAAGWGWIGGRQVTTSTGDPEKGLS